MSTPKDAQSNINVDVNPNEDRGGNDRRAEATSKETMRGLTSNKSQSNKDQDEGEETGSAPSPDGQFDNPRGGGKDDAGPM